MDKVAQSKAVSRTGSMRIIFDLQACQTAGSARRGVGRYSESLLAGVLRLGREFEVHGIANRGLPHHLDLADLQPNRMIELPGLPDWHSSRQFQGGDQDQLDGLALSAWLAPLKADVIHVSHVFEGFSERVALPAIERRLPGQVVSATLYDLIPLVFSEHYFQNDDFRRWYFSRIAWLQQADLLLAISESSRADAIDLIGIEPSRIVTVYGGVAEHFQPASNRAGEYARLKKKFSLKGKIVLYAGGDDHRKNIAGAIAGFAAIPAPKRVNCQLVIVCAMGEETRSKYSSQCKAAGLADDDILITGYVEESDLVSFYQCCDVFVFPSLYEGLGLPVLEAMACGAPVVGGDNSSIRELIVRTDALFDARSPNAIAKSITDVLSNQDFARSLRAYSLTRSKEFSWERTAGITGDAFETATERSRNAGTVAAANGWLPRKRLAILSPLPPCRSGIADYNARFLPYLGRHFEIDLYVDDYQVSDAILTAAWPVFGLTAFRAVAKNYDAILYEFGNSEFHHHMLPLLEEFPGVVGLHDAFLSGMFGYLDFHLGDTGSYSMEMLAAHGPRARRFYSPVQRDPEPNGNTMVSLPCTKRVIDMATGVISHSPFNLDMARCHYPEAWQAPYRIIPQMVPLPKAWTDKERTKKRHEMGYERDDIVITTFGHVVWTKLGDQLLEAFLQSDLAKSKHVRLVFAGELAKDEFGKKLFDTVRDSGLSARISITGYLTDKDYEAYLRITDIAVQLRQASRGGTPKSVLDCLAFGVPVVVNNDASFKDYPDDVVVKLSAKPDLEEIAARLGALCQEAETRNRFSNSGLDYVRAHHDPASCAAKYAAAIAEFCDREAHADLVSVAQAMAPHLARTRNVSLATAAAGAWLEGVKSPLFQRRRLLIDVSHIAALDHNSGIQRVVKQLTRALYCSNRAGFEPLAVRLQDGKLSIATEWLRDQGLLLARELSRVPANEQIDLRTGDILFMLDSSWARWKEFYPTFESARGLRVPIYTLVHDLLPIRMPECFGQGTTEWFEGWLRDAIRTSDGLICVSRATAEDLKTYIAAHSSEFQRIPKIGFSHNGSDFSIGDMSRQPSDQVASLDGRPYLLMIGTVEPRKSHELALDALEKLWSTGCELGLCIAGKDGWMVGGLKERLKSHPELGKRLFRFDRVDDADVHYLYANAKGLFFPSKGEGFGLPLIEAAHHGIPILCSDIPVFREIAGEYATYVNIRDPVALVSQIQTWWERCKKNELKSTSGMPRLTWEQSGERLLDLIMKNQWTR